MGEDNEIKKELTEIKMLLKTAQRRADLQWVYSIGFAGVIGSLALLVIKADTWSILLVFFAGLILMIISPYLGGK
ncbi:MAG: hypothetical protein DRI01_01560 [Chloroflexi bacterium]|nr:MAG: hypothetical protein DRI01_01560 [Chloroflexota bacterium]